jgi:hypothetical protein
MVCVHPSICGKIMAQQKVAPRASTPVPWPNPVKEDRTMGILSDGLPEGIADRFWLKVNKTDTCWLWTASLHHGYGQISTRRGKGPARAHAVSWMLHFGPIPEQQPRLCVLHKCDVRSCVNPAHLFLGTDADNIHDMDRKGRRVNAPRFGTRHHNAKLNEKRVLQIVADYAAGGVSQRLLAARNGVCLAEINHILTGRLWSHITKIPKKQ